VNKREAEERGRTGGRVFALLFTFSSLVRGGLSKKEKKKRREEFGPD